mmetsp:Transcript_9406/g.9738  ORF Transcript_9406/g.9738 Transcript_9406/m.9738 type:complete len:170 (+) Transcript_9406:49-558(+)
MKNVIAIFTIVAFCHITNTAYLRKAPDSNYSGGKAYGQLKMRQIRSLQEINKSFLEDEDYENIENLEDKLNGLLDQFVEFDLNNSGDINIIELKMMIEKKGLQRTHLELRKMIGKVDLNKSGTINYDEFVIELLSQEDSEFKEIVQTENVSDKEKKTGIAKREINLDLI